MPIRYKLAAAVPLATAMIFGQSLDVETPAQSPVHAYTYTGDIVNANCYLAASIVNRNSRGYTPVRATNAFTRSRQKTVANATPEKKKAILRHCSINPGITAFALLNDDGNFLKLDDKGNLKVMSQTESRQPSRAGAKKIRVSVTGSVDGETLIVQTISKM